MASTAWQEEAKKLAAGGTSWNSIAKQLNVARASVRRYLKSPGIKKTASAEARALIKVRNQKLEGNLDRALQEAYLLRGLAESKQDTKTWLAASKQIARILAMQSKTLPKVQPDVSVSTVDGSL